MTVHRSLLSAAVVSSLLGMTACTEDGKNGADGQPGISNTLIELNLLGRYQSTPNVFDGGAAEIVAHDSENQRLFVINSAAVTVDVLDIQDPTRPVLLNTIDASAEGGSANSVAVYGGLVAVAIEATTKTDNGKVVFYNALGLGKLGEVTVGALPDMVTFTRNGQTLLVANEGEPSDDYGIDPEGSVSVIDLAAGVAGATVTSAGFAAFNEQAAELRAQGVRLFGPGATVAQDLEPEYIAVSLDNATAWITLQENNAVAELDIATAEVTAVLPLGYKDYSVIGNELDASNLDSGIVLRNWPVKGMYQPDAIASYGYNGNTYYVTANEGDSRDYAGFSEEFRIGDLTLDAAAFPNAAELQDDANLGRLNVTSTLGVSNGCDPSNPATDVTLACEYDALYAYGARSFAIWAADGTRVFDSGSEFERITAAVIPDNFNSNNDENSFDSRSDDKGPEPESVVTGTINGQTFAFIGLERVGGLMVYNVTNPQHPVFVQYLNNRAFTVSQADVEAGMGGDLGPEGAAFIAATDSPTGHPMLVIGNEVSGTTTLYDIDVVELAALR
ncbi:choice-of-anchor I family protein [Marinobacter caseinilyticus]|uniref:choice-of-anchor I family protein n=1 Tax=Marinobacter caseinilyticus TaxID=2692195 RepID=UPI00140CBCF6|nr:choice-of-anchor I family protein [Marinobacter caseinilyticus]